MRLLAIRRLGASSSPAIEPPPRLHGEPDTGAASPIRNRRKRDGRGQGIHHVQCAVPAAFGPRAPVPKAPNTHLAGPSHLLNPGMQIELLANPPGELPAFLVVRRSRTGRERMTISSRAGPSLFTASGDGGTAAPAPAELAQHGHPGRAGSPGLAGTRRRRRHQERRPPSAEE